MSTLAYDKCRGKVNIVIFALDPLVPCANADYSKSRPGGYAVFFRMGNNVSMNSFNDRNCHVCKNVSKISIFSFIFMIDFFVIS